MTTITSKGQVTVPKKFRDYLGLQPGSEVEFTLGQHGEVIVTPATAARRRSRKGRLDNLRATLDTGKSTDALMQLLRGYDSDARDPGLK
ncbi:MAG: AbrB/MazE/SpoVT family DNA-binding domain-containing protein [Rhodanobacteraceae bacterium]